MRSREVIIVARRLGGVSGCTINMEKMQKIREQRTLMDDRCERSLARSDSGHVVVLAESAQVFVQLLNLLLVCLDAFALQTFIQLQHVSNKAGR